MRPTVLRQRPGTSKKTGIDAISWARHRPDRLDLDHGKLGCFGGWLIYTCFKLGQWVLLIVGAIFVPVGVIHGWLIWFEAW